MKKKNKPGQGRKSLYGEPTKSVTTKVPKSKISQFKKEAKENILKKWQLERN
jgi:hypothetical protein